MALQGQQPVLGQAAVQHGTIPAWNGTEEPHWWRRKVNKYIQYQELGFQQLLYPRPLAITEPHFLVIETLSLNTLQ